MDLAEFQQRIHAIYGQQDASRGIDGTFAWFIEEVGELSRAIRREGHAARIEEFSDTLAWLVSLASLCDVDIAEAAHRYADGCPKCDDVPCRCGDIDPDRP
jgi:NTP pyrophosphatase (non-canonical NTP hydrolase)